MNPRARRFLSWTFILAFFLIAPAIIFSTAGYRYNFTTHKIERTGVLIVESRPEGAAVWLNGKLQKSSTPARLQKLAPGSYDLRVEKTGYLGWKKMVTIESSETTFLNEIVLFRNEAPTLLASASSTAGAAFSFDARYGALMVATGSGSELTVIDTRTGASMRPYRSSAAADSFRLTWSHDGRKLLIRRKIPASGILVWNSAAPTTVRDVKKETGLPISDIAWAQDVNLLYATAGGTLYEIDPDLLSGTATGPAPKAAVVADDAVYGITAGHPAALVRRRLRDESFEIAAELPSEDFAPIQGRDRKVAYASSSGDRLFVIDAAASGLKAFEGHGADGVWSDDGTRLLYWNSLEVRVYDSRSGTDDLVTRLGSPIRQAAWHDPEWNVLYAVDDGLFAIETADYFGRVTAPLTTFSELRTFAVSQNGDFAYVFGAKDGGQGLWRLRLR